MTADDERGELAAALFEHQGLVGARDPERPAVWFRWCICGWDGGPLARGEASNDSRSYRAHLADALLAPGGVVDEIAGKRAAEAKAKVQVIAAQAEDFRGAWRTASESADRFRDVLAEALGHPDENPGDDVLIRELREHFGKTGPEPMRWRNFLVGARAQLDQIEAMPDPIAAALDAES